MWIYNKNNAQKRCKPRRPPSKHADIQLPEQLAPEIEKGFDIVLDSARAEYQGVVYTTWATQNAKIRTFLWLSIVILSTEGVLLWNIINDKSSPDGDILFILFFAMLLSFASFIFGLDSMRAREGVMRPVHGEDYSYPFKLADTGYVRELRKAMIEALSNCITKQLREVNFLGKRMGYLPYLLIISSIYGSLAFICYVIAKLVQF